MCVTNENTSLPLTGGDSHDDKIIVVAYPAIEEGRLSPGGGSFDGPLILM